MSLIRALGADYCRSSLRESFINYNGQPYRIGDVGSTNVALVHLITGEQITVNGHEVLSSFSALEYPELGYRKVGRFAVYSRRQGTTRRGIHPGCVNFQLTQASHLYMVAAERGRRRDAPGIPTREVHAQIIVPTYDSASVLDDLVAGRAVAYVPCADVCIEPNHSDNQYNIFWREKLCGTMSSDKTLNISSPAMRAIISKYIPE